MAAIAATPDRPLRRETPASPSPLPFPPPVLPFPPPAAGAVGMNVALGSEMQEPARSSALVVEEARVLIKPLPPKLQASGFFFWFS